MLGNHLLALRHRTPRIRGKEAILRFLDRRFSPFQATTKGGIQLPIYCSSLQDEMLIRLDSNQSAEHTLNSLIEKLRDGDVVLDVGANIGYYSVLASQKVGKEGLVIALEPSRREFIRLLSALQWNRTCNVIPCKLAASNAGGFVALSVAREHSGRNSVVQGNCGEKSSAVEVVPTVSLDGLISCFAPNRRIAICKIDVEGNETKVLQGMTGLLSRKMVRGLCVEVDLALLANAGSSKKELYDLMEKHGYAPRVRSSSAHFDEVFDAR